MTTSTLERRAPLASPGVVRRRGFEVDAIDVFCGFGGSSQGIHASGATVLAAANHNALSIECHARNFPDTEHWIADLVDETTANYVDPAALPAARFAWFSPSCTHHSPANATKIYDRGYQLAVDEDDDWDEQAFVKSERSRVTMSCVLRYAAARQPEVLVTENVAEVCSWGPGRNGATFKWWVAELRKLGYEVRVLFLNSMFFPPCPQSRDRVYIAAWRKGNTAPDLDFRPPAFCTSDRCGGLMVDAVQTWKPATAAWLGLPEWGKYLRQYDYRCPKCHKQVHPASWMALSAIDWSDLGPRIGDRKRRPAPNTMERIRQAIRKYWNAPPVLLPHAQAAAHVVPTAHVDRKAADDAIAASVPIRTGNRGVSVAEHLGTLSQRNNAALMLMVKNNGDLSEAGYRGHHSGGQLGSITVHPTQSLVALVPNRTHNVAHAASGSLSPVMTSATQAVVVAAHTKGSDTKGTRARPIADTLFTQTTTEEFALAALPTLRGDHAQDNPAGGQVPTVSAGGTHQGLVTAMFSKINGGPGDTAWHTLDDPLNAVTARDTHGLVLLPWVDQWRSDPALITEQLATVTTHLRHSLASIEPYDGEISDALLDDVRFRMLQPDPELRRAMAFGDDYQLVGTKEQMTAGLGNAVTPPVAAWITARCIDTLRGDREAVA